MSKQAKKQQSTSTVEPQLQVSGKFYSAFKASHLLYVAVEVELKDGQVVSTRVLSRAPDLAASAVGHCSKEIWNALRSQDLAEVMNGKA